MSYNICWQDDDKQILLITFGEEITYPKLYQLYEDCADLLDTVSRPVVLVHDVSQLRYVMKIDVVAMAKLPRMRIIQHPNWLCSYFAHARARSQIILNVATSLFPQMMRKSYTTDTLQEALASAREKLSILR